MKSTHDYIALVASTHRLICSKDVKIEACEGPSPSDPRRRARSGSGKPALQRPRVAGLGTLVPTWVGYLGRQVGHLTTLSLANKCTN